MAELHFKDKDRIIFSTLVAVLIHVGIFFLIQWLVKTLPDVPEYSGPLFVEITDSNAPVMDAEELAELPPEEEPPPPEEEIPEALPEELPEPEPLPIDDTALADALDTVPVRTSPPTTPRPTTRTTPRATPRITTRSTPRPTARATVKPTPTEKSAFSGDILTNLDNALDNTPTVATAAPEATTKPADTTGSVTGTTTGGNTPQISWDVAAEPRQVIQRGTPDISGLGDLEFSEVEVELAFSVLPQGFLDTDIKIVRSSGYTEVDNVALDALKKYKFKAITGTGKTSARIVFKIRNQ